MAKPKISILQLIPPTQFDKNIRLIHITKNSKSQTFNFYNRYYMKYVDYEFPFNRHVIEGDYEPTKKQLQFLMSLIQ